MEKIEKSRAVKFEKYGEVDVLNVVEVARLVPAFRGYVGVPEVQPQRSV